MNSIIQKAVDELVKESPNIDYVRGMLETVLAMNSVPEGSFLFADGKGNVRVTTHEKEIKKALDSSLVSDIPAVNVDHIKKIAGESLG